MTHVPVLAAEAVGALVPRDGGLYVDATFGGGGYTRLLLAQARCRVVAIDRDPEAVARAQDLARSEPDLSVVAGRFGHMAQELRALGIDGVDGIVLDLGVSSYQLDTAERGFSFRRPGPLDMRMDREGPSAADLLATLDEAELARILRTYGDEPDARRIARAIVADRKAAPFTTTDALAGLVARVKGWRGGQDPATLTFQALRMAVNDELGELARALEAAEELLRPGGRLVVVTFHSGEDSLVKRFIDQRGGRPASSNRHLPPTAQAAPRWRWVSRKVATAGALERAHNPRARSAKLRVALRLEAGARSSISEPGISEASISEGGEAWRRAA
jgi:16S rRNA (cytosine1402-N4)-methyltransferase